MLPCIFPPFPERDEFDIFASMDPAKEVGGDFYDFFLIDQDHLGLVIADVSGKGVSAALFMVISKTLLKNCALSGASPKEVLETVNNQLCENNKAKMFVTVWLGWRICGIGNKSKSKKQEVLEMKELTLEASLAHLNRVQEFVSAELEKAACPLKARLQIELVVEEIYVNIARYAYHPGTGSATVRCEIGREPLQVILQFLDEGVPFNPLEKKDADTTLPAEAREPGGLGILLVKKSMDLVDYRYENGKNILTLRKCL